MARAVGRSGVATRSVRDSAVGALPPDSAVLTGITAREDMVWDNGSWTPAREGSGAFWFWPPVGPQARQLRVTVSTLREAAWALVGIPGR
jgi:hypothetical protein